MFLESKLRLRALIFSGAVLCMFMLVVASVSIPARAQPHKQPPNLVGMTIEQARKVLEKLGFQVIEHPYSTVFPKRHHKVIAQRVGSGDKGGRSSPILQSLSPYSSQSQTVEVWFYDLNTRLRPELPAQGGSAPGAEQNKTVRVPFLIGLSQQQAFLSLVKLGLNLVVAERRETGVPALAGTIASQRPNPGSEAKPKSKVDVVLYVLEEDQPGIMTERPIAPETTRQPPAKP